MSDPVGFFLIVTWRLEVLMLDSQLIQIHISVLTLLVLFFASSSTSTFSFSSNYVINRFN